MAKQIVLITGCSSGMGIDFAVTMAKDLAVFGTPAPLYSKLPSAVNNAEFGQFNAFEEVSMEKVRAIFEVNMFGRIQLCQQVIPKMKERKSGRIIFIGAGMGLVGYPFNEFYSAAYFAMEGFAEAFAPIGRQFNIWVSTIEPGPVSTDWDANVTTNGMGIFAGGIGNEADPETQRLAENMSNKMQGTMRKMTQTPEEITSLLLEILSSETPHLRYATSKHTSEVYKRKYVDITGDEVVEEMCQLLS